MQHARRPEAIAKPHSALPRPDLPGQLDHARPRGLRVASTQRILPRLEKCDILFS
jgi:hypothetical protein